MKEVAIEYPIGEIFVILFQTGYKYKCCENIKIYNKLYIHKIKILQ